MAARGVSLEAVATTAVTAAAVEEWARHAAPGEQLTYFTGPRLLQEAPAVVAARRLEAQGEVLFFQRRKAPGLFDYVMQRRRNAERPPLSRAGVEDRAPGTRFDDELEDLMAVLRRLASLALECPSNKQLAEKAGLKDAESARYRLGLLQQQGRIEVRTPPEGPRVITIVSSGQSTAGGAR
jgi:hypothetical protein